MEDVAAQNKFLSCFDNVTSQQLKEMEKAVLVERLKRWRPDIPGNTDRAEIRSLMAGAIISALEKHDEGKPLLNAPSHQVLIFQYSTVIQR